MYNAEMREDRLKLKFELGEFESGKIFVPVDLDSKKLDFFLDTGATFTDLKDISLLRNPKVIGDHSFQSASGLKLNAKQVICERFSLGGLEQESKKLSILPEEFKHATTLGIEVFQKAHFSLLSDKKELTCNLKNIPLVNTFTLTKKGHIGVKCKVREQSFLGIWDTGAELTVISEELRKKCKNSFSNPRVISNGTDSTGAKVKLTLWDMECLEIRGEFFKNIKVLEMDFEPLKEYFPDKTEMIIGFNLIVKANWRFDMPSKTFDIELSNQSTCPKDNV